MAVSSVNALFIAKLPGGLLDTPVTLCLRVWDGRQSFSGILKFNLGGSVIIQSVIDFLKTLSEALDQRISGIIHPGNSPV